VRKIFLAAVVAAVAVAGFSVLASADEGQQGTSWTFSFSSKAKASATGSNSIIEPAKRDTKGTEDPSDDHYDAPKVSTIKFPVGSGIDTSVLARCTESPSDVQRGEKKCPANTKIGSGLANSLLGQPDEGGGAEVVAPIEAFNQKKGILFVVRPCSPGTGPGKGSPCAEIPAGTVVLVGSWSNVTTQPTLRVPTPAALLQGGVTITRFQLKTNKKTKRTTRTVNGKKRIITRSYATTPGKCKGTWKSFAIEEYEDGSKQTIPDEQTCKR
jgi:hypothetical protein